MKAVAMQTYLYVCSKICVIVASLLDTTMSLTTESRPTSRPAGKEVTFQLQHRIDELQTEQAAASKEVHVPTSHFIKTS